MELHYNGNGSPVNGRGLRHRKMTRAEAVELAADIASGRPFAPSLHHLADIFGVSLGSLSKAVKARAAAQEVSAASEEVYLGGSRFSTELSVLTQAWYAANSDERESFLREEIVPRVIR
jgi:hypothetical protein